MALVRTYNTIVTPNQEVIKIGPDSILYETVNSRENTDSGTVSFQLQNKGEECLLDAQVYLEVPITITKQLANGNADNFVAKDEIAFHEPLQLIKNVVFNYNGTSITAQPAVGGIVESVVFDNPDSVRSSNIGAIEDLGLYHLTESRYDTPRWQRIMDFKNLTGVGANTYTTTVFIPLQFPPFKTARNTKWFSKMSNMLPFVNNSELSLQFFNSVPNGAAIQVFDSATAAAPNVSIDTNVFTASFAAQKAKLHLRWYQLPMNMRLNDVYDIGGWTKDIIFPTGGNLEVNTGVANYTSTFLARTQMKPDAIIIYAEPNKDKGSNVAAAANVTYNNNKVKPGCLSTQNPLLSIKSLDITIDTVSGAFTTTVDNKYLRFLTRQNFNSKCGLSDIGFNNNKNFVWLSAEQISSLTKIPAGVWSNSTIQVTVNFHTYKPLNQPAGTAFAATNVEYTPYMLLYSSHQTIRVTRDSSEVIRNGVTEAQFAALMSGQSVSGASVNSSMGVQGYRSRL